MIANLIILPLIISGLISFFATRYLIKLAPKLGVMDDPKKRREPATLHPKPIPRGGGISLYLALAATSVLLLPFDQRLAGILLGGLVLVAVGFLDDKGKGIHPYYRLSSQVLAAGLVVASGIGIAFVSNPLGPGVIDLSLPRLSFEFSGEIRQIWVLSAAFGFIWIMALMNFVSWSSGVDGQLSGFTAIAAFIIALLSLRFSADITQWSVTILAASVAGAFLGFLPWHIYPQKIMPGFGGGTLAGFMLAVLAILTTTKVGTLLVVLALPLVDALYSIARRIYSGKNPIWGDRGHFHHKLLDAGWSKRGVSLFYWLVTAILGAIALRLGPSGKLYTIIGIILILGLLSLWLRSFQQSSNRPGPLSG